MTRKPTADEATQLAKESEQWGDYHAGRGEQQKAQAMYESAAAMAKIADNARRGNR